MNTKGRSLTLGQAIILGVATAAMIGIGILGAYGTYTNIHDVFQSATALGVVAAGEGATFILALVYVGLTMLGQSSPTAVRLGLWLLPAVASGVGAVVAPTTTAAVVYAVTPLAMCTAAEGAGLLARRIVVRTTGEDAEALRRNAETLRRLAYERARAVNHPGKWTKRRAERRAWRLAARVGTGDTGLGTTLVTVQRERVTTGADMALTAMYSTPTNRLALPAAPSVDTAVPEVATETVTQVTATEDDPDDTPTTPPVTASQDGVTAVTLDQLAAVAGVPVPPTGETLTPAQLDVVLRWLRYRSDPPVSYRQAVGAFRDAGFVGGEARVRRAWGDLMSREEEPDGPTPVPVH